MVMKPSKTNYEDIILASDSSILEETLTKQEQFVSDAEKS